MPIVGLPPHTPEVIESAGKEHRPGTTDWRSANQPSRHSTFQARQTEPSRSGAGETLRPVRKRRAHPYSEARFASPREAYFATANVPARRFPFSGSSVRLWMMRMPSKWRELELTRGRPARCATEHVSFAKGRDALTQPTREPPLNEPSDPNHLSAMTAHAMTGRTTDKQRPLAGQVDYPVIPAPRRPYIEHTPRR